MSDDAVATPRRPDHAAWRGGVTFPNPVFTASGCAAAGPGAATSSSTSRRSAGSSPSRSCWRRARAGRRRGWPRPRAGCSTPSACRAPASTRSWRRTCLAGRARRARRRVDRRRQRRGVRQAGARLRGRPGLAMIEVNISLPQRRGPRAGLRLRPARPRPRSSQAVRRNTAPGVPVFAKLSPGRHRHHRDRAGLRRRRRRRPVGHQHPAGHGHRHRRRMRPVLGGVTGGLSGPAIRPVAVRCVWQVHQALPDVPILGMGGIRTGLDALEFVLAGASARSASAPPSSATRRRRCGSCTSSGRRWPSAASTALRRRGRARPPAAGRCDVPRGAPTRSATRARTAVAVRPRSRAAR